MITQTQLEILRHSLGLDMHGRGNQYRNHYCCQPDHADCNALVAQGFMETPDKRPTMLGENTLFFVTEAGKAKAVEGVKPLRFTRAQRRYQDYLRAADAFGCTFGDYLKNYQHYQKFAR